MNLIVDGDNACVLCSHYYAPSRGVHRCARSKRECAVERSTPFGIHLLKNHCGKIGRHFVKRALHRR